MQAQGGKLPVMSSFWGSNVQLYDHSWQHRAVYLLLKEYILNVLTRHKTQWPHSEVTAVLTNLIAVIILQYVSVSNHHVLPLKLVQCSVSVISPQSWKKIILKRSPQDLRTNLRGLETVTRQQPLLPLPETVSFLSLEVDKNPHAGHPSPASVHNPPQRGDRLQRRESGSCWGQRWRITAPAPRGSKCLALHPSPAGEQAGWSRESYSNCRNLNFFHESLRMIRLLTFLKSHKD